MDKQMITDQIAGLEASIKTLRDTEKLFLKVQGIDEEIESSRQKAIDTNADAETLKADIAEKKTEKSKAMASTANALAGAMGAVLSTGEAVFDITDGKVFLGWKFEDRVTAYPGLSGGEKVAFDSALSNVLLGEGEKLTILEAAEVDSDNLSVMLSKIAKEGSGQFIVATCHQPNAPLLADWNIVAL